MDWGAKTIWEEGHCNSYSWKQMWYEKSDVNWLEGGWGVCEEHGS